MLGQTIRTCAPQFFFTLYSPSSLSETHKDGKLITLFCALKNSAGNPRFRLFAQHVVIHFLSKVLCKQILYSVCVSVWSMNKGICSRCILYHLTYILLC